MKSKKITKKTLKKLNSLARELELSTGLMVRWASWRDGERYFCFELVPWERQNRYRFISGEKSVSAALSEFRRNIAYLLLDKTITDYYKPARQEEDQQCSDHCSVSTIALPSLTGSGQLGRRKKQQ